MDKDIFLYSRVRGPKELIQWMLTLEDYFERNEVEDYKMVKFSYSMMEDSATYC